MTEKNPKAPAIPSIAEPETVPVVPQEAGITTSMLLEERPTPVAIGAEAPPSVSLDLSSSGPFGAY